MNILNYWFVYKHSCTPYLRRSSSSYDFSVTTDQTSPFSKIKKNISKFCCIEVLRKSEIVQSILSVFYKNCCFSLSPTRFHAVLY